MQSEIARIFGLPESNVDVFTVLNPDIANDEKVVDVRFSAHGSPYLKAENLEGRLAPEKERVTMPLLLLLNRANTFLS